MMNTSRERYYLIKPCTDEVDSLGQAAFTPRDELLTDEYTKGAEIIKVYISPSPGERRISRTRSTGFDYITITHHAVTSCRIVEKGMYLRKIGESKLWRVDYVVQSWNKRCDALLYLFELL